MAKKITINGSNLLENLSQDWGGQNNGTTVQTVYDTEIPVGAEWGMNRDEVERFLKAKLSSLDTDKAGEFYYDSATSKYLVFADVDSRDLYLSDREENAGLLLGTFDAPANYTAEITMLTPASNVLLSGTTGNYIDFTFDVKSKTGSSTGEAVIATFTFNNGGNIKKVTQVYAAGTSVHFLADQYLSNGTNNVSVSVTGRNTLASSMVAVTFTVVALGLTSEFDFSKAVEYGGELSFPYTLTGAGVKYVEWYIDGVALLGTDTITDIKASRIKSIDISSLTAGKHNIQVRAYITSGGTNYYSKTLYYDFVVEPETWSDNVTYPLLGLLIPAPATTGAPSVTVTQYEEFVYNAAVYDSRERSVALLVLDNASQVQSITTQPEQIEDMVYIPVTVGSHTITFSADGTTSTISVTCQQGSVEIEEETDALLLKLSAKGRSNSETNPAQWTFGQITTLFTGFSWNAQSGWNNGALVIPSGAYIDINYAPLGGNPITNGRTIEIDYETTNIDNEDASVISLVNSQTNAGLTVTASTAKLQSSGGANVNTKYKDGDRVHLAFIINKTTGDNGRLMFIVNNGIVERAASFAADDVLSVSDTLRIGSAGCTVKVHSVRVYDKALTIDQSFCNFAVDSDNIIEIANRNDIINEQTGMIDVDKVNAKIPVLIITGDMQPIFDANDKNTTVYVDMEYRNLQDATKNFTATHVRMRPQGTSSLGYPRKNLRPYTSSKYGCVMKDANGDVITDGKYAFKDGAQPVNCWTLKADYAESSGSHNTGAARLWNDLMYNCQLNGDFVLRTNAQKAALANEFGYDVRTAIDGFPIVVFYRENENSELICLGQYNFNNDKSTESVFGFTGITGFDNTNVQCFEFLENENPICLFDDVSDFDNSWDAAFESRYPDTKTPSLTALKSLATWINSCKNNQSKWEDEKEDHFDLPKLAAYYVYLMRFGAVDQAVKNSMLMTEDGTHWFFINYDNDTIIGIDNISTVLNVWNYNRATQKTNGSYYFAGHNSVLWNCFEADEECMNLVMQIDNALYSAGLTYNNMVKMFDEEQCNKWCERIYNENGQYKYIQPFKDKGSAVLYMLQGSRKSYRHWWLQHRMDYYDAMWASGAFRNRIIRFIAEGAEGGAFTITADATTFYGYGINSVTQEAGVEVTKGQTHDFTITKTLAIGDPVAIYNANNISKVDLSDFIEHLTTLYINQAVGNDGESSLKSLILGDGTNENTVFTEIGGLTTINGIEELDVRGFKGITSMELGNLASLHIFKAADSGLTSFAPATGVTLTTVSLPSTIQTINLNAANVTALTYTPTTTLRSVSLRNVGGTWDAKTFVNTWLGLLSDEQLASVELTLIGIDWTNMTAAQAIAMGKVGTKNYQGKITLSSLAESEYNQLVTLFGANVFNSDGAFVIDAPTQVFISGPSEIKEGNSGTFTATFFPVTENTIKYLLYNGTTLIEAQTDQQGKVYRIYNGVTLYEESGVMSVSTVANDVSVKVRAQVSGTTDYSSYLDVVGKKITYPTAVTVSGAGTVNQNGMYNYTKALSGTYNADVTNVAWTLSTNSASSLYAQDASGATVNVTNTPATSIDVTLTCTVTFEGGVTRTGTKTITMVLTFPSSVSISGPATIDDNGDYNYTKTINGSYTAALTGVNWTLTSNANVTIKSSDNNGAVVTAPQGNDTAVTLTLTCTCTFSGGVTRSGTKSIAVSTFDAPPVEEWVDLGLPSGLLWCNHNVGATNPEDAGLYFAYNNETGYDGTGTKPRPGNAENITLAHDAAQAYMGADWRMPTQLEAQELLDETDRVWATINGKNGYKFINKSDSNKWIFIPACGYYSNNISQYNSALSYRTSTHDNSSYARGYLLNGYSTWINVNSIDGSIGYLYPVRAVREAPKMVDLGLPSGTLWADRNVGATAPEAAGLYFAWGETEGYKDAADRNAKLTAETGTTYSGGFDTTSYNRTGGASGITGNLSGDNDAATVNLGGSWRMPSKEDLAELFDNTNQTDVVVNGKQCVKFSHKTNSSIYIIVPYAGIVYNSEISSTFDQQLAIFSSSIYDGAMNAYCLFMARLGHRYDNKNGNQARYRGIVIRPVQ